MKFVQFRCTTDPKTVLRVGIQIEDGVVVDLSRSLPFRCRNLVEALEIFGIDELKKIAQSCAQQKVDESYEILAPITKQDKLICIGLNYRDHCLEQGSPIPDEPIVFCKFPSAIIGPNQDLPYPAIWSWMLRQATTVLKEGRRRRM